ncbi:MULTISPECIES: hypothetical protein [unclassified Bradyrhizobium]
MAILIMILHVAGGAMLGPQAHASTPDDEAKCPADAMLPGPSLPFD